MHRMWASSASYRPHYNATNTAEQEPDAMAGRALKQHEKPRGHKHKTSKRPANNDPPGSHKHLHQLPRIRLNTQPRPGCTHHRRGGIEEQEPIHQHHGIHCQCTWKQRYQTAFQHTVRSKSQRNVPTLA